jgi:glutathione synthase/RimK-type ligase-like ATP-grasp enzyme
MSKRDVTRGPVAIATCSAVRGKEEDDLRLIDAVGQLGVRAEHQSWDDDRVDWNTYPLVVVRSTWDYPERREDFLSWLARLKNVLNPFSTLRWNIDKHYLDDLSRAGLPVIPTQFLEPGHAFQPPPWPFVVKPAVSCGAKQTARYRRGDGDQAREHVRSLHASGRSVMIQPYLSNIDDKGEVALVFIDDTYSHSVRRSALLNHAGRIHAGEMIPSARPCSATADELALAERVLAVVRRSSSKLLYARVDLAPGPDGEPLILEVELTEPSLFLGYSPNAAERLAEAIVSALATG